jgi:putative ABC transport system permease protein
LERSWVVSLESKGTHIVALRKGSIELLSADLDESFTSRIREVPGVAAVMAGLGDLVELETGQMAYVAGRPPDSEFWKNLVVNEGKVPTASEPNGVVLGEALARTLAKKPGGSIRLSGRDFDIVGISRQPSVLDDRSVMMPMPTMQRLIGREGKVSGFHIRIEHPEIADELARVQTRLGAAFPELIFIESGEIGRNTQITQLLRAIAWSSSTIALGMAFVVVLNTLLMSVAERNRELGLLCALGWSPSRVMAIVILDGLILSAAGAAVGSALGLVCIRWISSHPKLGGLFQPEVTTGLISEAVGMALLLGFLGGLYPAWRATRLNPMELLRSE